VTERTLGELAQRFRRFAEVECRGWSPLYDHLASSVADDQEVLALAAHAPPGQPVPNLFLGAVHLLLLSGERSPVAEFYADLTERVAPATEAYPVFRAFCLAHVETIRHLLATRRVQTNEVGRCTYLFPAFMQVFALARYRPLALVEIGTSAGLNLMWDRYGYRYGDDAVCGERDSPVQLTCALRGDRRPPLPLRVPAVARKMGVDLNVIDVRDPDAVQWLHALVWPEARERATTLRNAIEVTRADPPDLRSGDGLALLPAILEDVPAKVPVCVFHTHTVNQFSSEARERLSAWLVECGRERELYRISAEWLGTVHPQVEVTAWRDGVAEQRLLAYCDPHGRWLEWVDELADAPRRPGAG
jgi:hypothetical protein